VSARVFVCESCGRAVFPRRLLCPDCGGRAFRDEHVETATLEDYADRGEVKLGAVRAPSGPLLIARVEGDPRRGGEVSLDEDGDVPVARA
jgi:uncharacterized OB-fold protein